MQHLPFPGQQGSATFFRASTNAKRIHGSTAFTYNYALRNYHRQNSLIQPRNLGEAFQALAQQQQTLDSGFCIRSLDICLEQKSLPLALLLHAHIIQTGIKQRLDCLTSRLITIYSRFGCLNYAERLLKEEGSQDIVAWSALMHACVRRGFGNKAFRLFNQMRALGMSPSHYTLAIILQAYKSPSALKQGMKTHLEIIRRGFESDCFLGSCLVQMYGSCGKTEFARRVFDQMPLRDVVCWTSMIGSYAKKGLIDVVFELYFLMQIDGVSANRFTFMAFLPAIGDEGDLRQGRRIHSQLIKLGFNCDVMVGSALIDMYVKLECLDDADKAFDELTERNVFTWTSLITGYARTGHREKAQGLFLQMQDAGICPNEHTLASILQACSSLDSVKMIHSRIIKDGFLSDLVLATSLVEIYSKCGSLDHAQAIYDNMPAKNLVAVTSIVAGYFKTADIDKAVAIFEANPELRDTVLWSTMILGFIENGQSKKALDVFQRMQLQRVGSDSMTFSSILPACAHLGALKNGREIHNNIILTGWDSNSLTTNALINMYAKCGSIDDARNVFDKMSTRLVSSWNAMITGYSIHGLGREAIEVFKKMQEQGTKPDKVTFAGLLSACCHSGLVEEAWNYFNSMSSEYEIDPEVEHYGCMVDLLGRSGSLEEAQNLIATMPMKPDALMWGSLLRACKTHGNVEVGERVAEHLLELEPHNSSHYKLLSNLYSSAGRWRDAERVRQIMVGGCLEMTPGCSWIEIGGNVHAFSVGDT